MNILHNKNNFFVRLIRLVMFLDMSINRKFLLFFVGVLLWFSIITVISLTTLVDIQRRSTVVVKTMVPQDRLVQKCVNILQGLRIDSYETMNAADSKIVIHNRSTVKTKIQDINGILEVLEKSSHDNIYFWDFGRFHALFDRTAVVLENSAGTIYVKNLLPVIKELDGQFEELANYRMNVLSKGPLVSNEAEHGKRILQNTLELLEKTYSVSNDYFTASSELFNENSRNIGFVVRCTSVTTVGVLFLSTFLLVLFTFMLSRNLTRPIMSIIKQIHSLGEGTVDLTKKLNVSSNDEIGLLSSEFNGLMESIHHMATYKKVIEEDESLDEVYSRLGKTFSDYVKLDNFFIFEALHHDGKMKIVQPTLITDDSLCCNKSILTNSGLCRAKKTGHPISSFSYRGICNQFNIECELEHVCLPVIVGGATGGVVQFLFDSESQKSMTKYERDRKVFTAQQYITESISVIEAKRLMNSLHDSSVKDALTGLYNRRFLQELTKNMLAGNARRNKTIGLIMCDLDYFKQVNDEYGHDVGDAVLVETAKLIVESVREADLVLRFGGEEFLVILMDIDEGDTFPVAQKIQTNFENKKIRIPGGTINKTISLGVSEFPCDTESFWQSIKYADVALYEAKRTGRNRAIRFTHEMWEGGDKF